MATLVPVHNPLVLPKTTITAANPGIGRIIDFGYSTGYFHYIAEITNRIGSGSGQLTWRTSNTDRNLDNLAAKTDWVEVRATAFAANIVTMGSLSFGRISTTDIIGRYMWAYVYNSAGTSNDVEISAFWQDWQ